MNFNSFRSINKGLYTSTVLCKNHYDALGLTPKATQGEIKEAYYKLSKIYHPDKNKGSESASDKFKDITAAYEVLGNFKSRRFYDRGIGNASLHSWKPEGTKSFKQKDSRFQPSRGGFTGGTPVYDFEEWSRLHYGQILEQRAQAKARYQEKMDHTSSYKVAVKNENFLIGITLLTTVYVIFYYTYGKSYDIPEKSSKSK